MADFIRAIGVRFMPKTANAIVRIDGQIAFTATANTAANVSMTMEKTEKRGGQNNVILGTLFSDSAVTASFTSVEWKPEFLAAKIGSVITIGQYDFINEKLQLQAVEGVVTLAEKPSDSKLYVNINGEFVSVPADTTTVDLTAFGVKNECVKAVAIFKRLGKRVNLSAESTPTVGELTLSSPIFEGTKGEVGEGQYVFPAFQFDGNWNQDFSGDANYEMAGSAIATDSTVCGEGQSYGSYVETYKDDSEIMSFSAITAAPSIVEIKVADTETVTVYGSKGALYAPILISNEDVTFASSTPETATVSAEGVITGVAVGETTVTVTYKGLKAEIEVDVSAAE